MLCIIGKHFIHHVPFKALGDRILAGEKCIVEEGNIVLHAAPQRDILARLFAASADTEYPHRLFAVSGKNGGKFRIEFLCPGKSVFVYLIRRQARDNVFGNVVQLVQIEKRTGYRHFFGGEAELFDRQIGVGDPPFLEIGIEQSKKIFSQGGCRIAFGIIKRERGFRILALADLALVAVIQL